MQIADKTYNTIALVNSKGELVALLSDNQIINMSDITILAEAKVGDIVFLPLDNGHVQCAYKQKGMPLPIGTMNSEQFLKYSEENMKRAEEDNKETEASAKEEKPAEEKKETAEEAKKEDVTVTEEPAKEEPAKEEKSTKEEQPIEKETTQASCGSNLGTSNNLQLLGSMPLDMSKLNLGDIISKLPPDAIASLIKSFAGSVATQKSN